MKKAALLLMLLAPMLTTTACFRTHMMVSRSAAQSTTQVDWEGRWYHDIIYGLAEISGPVRLDKVCPGGVAEVYQETSFLNGLAQAVTGNLYNPQSVSIYCASGASAQVLVDRDGMAVAYVDADNRATPAPMPAHRR